MFRKFRQKIITTITFSRIFSFFLPEDAEKGNISLFDNEKQNAKLFDGKDSSPLSPVFLFASGKLTSPQTLSPV